MFDFPRWKVIVVAIISLAGIVFSVPNLLEKEQLDKMPSWFQPVSLGLDLQGGSHLLLEVDLKAVFKEQTAALIEGIRQALRKENIRYADLGTDSEGVVVKIINPDQRELARKVIRGVDAGINLDGKDDGFLQIRYTDQAKIERRNAAIGQSIEIVRRRIDELGTREPSIQRQGEDRILVQLPGVDDPDRIKRLLGKTAKLTFHLVDEGVSPEDAATGKVPPASQVMQTMDDPRGPSLIAIKKKVELGGDALTDSQPSFQDAMPVVSFRFNAQGGKRFGQITQENVGKRFAIVLDGKVISAPVIREPIMGGSGVISGNFTVQSAKDLAILLRAGALPAPLTILEERTVGPDLGADSIKAGKMASLIALGLVVVFMVLFYGLFGVFANIALVFNMFIMLGVLSLLGATLTLPGIAGFVLTMGMAVDANVLIYERIREESRLGRTPMALIAAGFERAFVTILDSNLTTLVAAILLFQFGGGPIRGFAVTLALGLLTSMFTAIMVTRLMIITWFRRTRPAKLPI